MDAYFTNNGNYGDWDGELEVTYTADPVDCYRVDGSQLDDFDEDCAWCCQYTGTLSATVVDESIELPELSNNDIQAID